MNDAKKELIGELQKDILLWEGFKPGLAGKKDLIGLGPVEAAFPNGVYVKIMDGRLLGISTQADTMQISWKSSLQLPYELCPSAIVEHRSVVYVPTHSGIAYAVDRKSGDVIWKYKVSNCLMNSILPPTMRFILARWMVR